jgi:hypothetical protein
MNVHVTSESSEMKINFQKSHTPHAKSLVVVAGSLEMDNFPVRVHHLPLPPDKLRKFHRTPAALNSAAPRHGREGSPH